MTMHQLLLIVLNRTTLAPADARFDVGVLANWRQVFGVRPWLWALPLTSAHVASGSGAGPTGDGVHWPVSESWSKREARASTIRATHAQAPVDAVRASGGLLIDPSEHVPPPQGYGRAGPRGRWALAEHQGRRAGDTLRGVLGVLERLRRLARAWERRLFCGIMVVGSFRLGHKLLAIVRARAHGGTPRPMAGCDSRHEGARGETREHAASSDAGSALSNGNQQGETKKKAE